MKNIFKNAPKSVCLKICIALFIIVALLKCVIFSFYNFLSIHQLHTVASSTHLRAESDWNQASIAPDLTIHHKRVISVDRQLRAMAMEYVEQPFIHPLISKHERENSNHTPSGPKMNSVREIASVTWPLLIDVNCSCGGNGGKGLLATVLVYCVAGDFSRRKAIRETFGSALKAHSQTEIYFVVAKVNNAS